MGTTRDELDALVADELLALLRCQLELGRHRVDDCRGGMVASVAEDPQNRQHERLKVRDRHATAYYLGGRVVERGNWPRSSPAFGSEVADATQTDCCGRGAAAGHVRKRA